MAVTYVSAMVFAETVAREQREAGLREAAGIASQSGATLGSIVADAILAAIPSPPNIGEGEQPWLKDRPTESGWYWVRTCHGDEEVVLVKGDTETCPLYVLEHGRAERHPLKDYADACEWKPIKFKE
ncbi:MAG: hypothetical protein A2002_08510 [Pseudomonadales bacterium GWC1_66_9]|nr:MAG: hypothetical protein A2002_08510 [Pseudomonadales bacterium GWC1_66_9]